MKQKYQFNKTHLSNQLLTSFGVALILAGITTLGINYWLQKNNLEHEVKAKAASISQSLKIISQVPYQSNQIERLKYVVKQYEMLPDVMEVVVLNSQGSVLAHTNHQESHHPYDEIHPELKTVMDTARQSNSELYQKTTLHDQPVLIHVLPFQLHATTSDSELALVVAVLDLASIQQESRQSFLISTTTMLGVTLGVLAMMGLLLKVMILRPLTQLAKEVTNSRKTGIFLMPHSFPNDEIQVLAETFNQAFQERQQAEQALQLRATWLREQGKILRQLAKHPALRQGNWQAAVQEMTEVTAATLLTERVSVWLYDETRSQLNCLDLLEYNPTTGHCVGHSAGLPLSVRHYPAYFDAIEQDEKPLVICDAQADPRTIEFTETYLTPLNIHAMLDVPIRVGGKVAGVLCIEQLARIRYWTPEDESFARSIGDLVALAIEARDRKRAEETIAKSEKQFRTLVSNIPGAVYRRYDDSLWSIDFISEAIQDIAGYPAADFRSPPVRSFPSLIEPEDLSLVARSIQQAIVDKTSYVVEYRIRHADGAIRWVSEKGQGVFTEAGELLYLDGVIFDATTRKQAELRVAQQAHALEAALTELQQTQTQIIQSEKMSSLGQMVAGVAHEINNPVNFIYGNINLANDDIQALLKLRRLYQTYCPVPSLEIQQLHDEIDFEFIEIDLPKMISSMRVGAERIREIVRSLRVFSRLDEAECKTVNIHDGIDSTLMILHHRLRADSTRPEIQVRKEYGPIPRINCFPGQLNQVFMNIISNAIDAIEDLKEANHPLQLKSKKPDNWIQIRTQQIDENRVQIRIADNGVGMPKTVQAKLFDPFFTTKPVGQGTGLGLSISYQIIHQHAGTLTCNSTHGQGTEFVIELPIWGRGGLTATKVAGETPLTLQLP